MGNQGWQEVRVDLSDFAMHSIRLRWRYGALDTSPMGGWWVDDVELLGPSLCPFWQIFGDGFESGGTGEWSSVTGE